ncbi:hypothetical protein HPB51_002053 [Rhipicephalus microplus]|uniref:Ig-like domain-containing protein n=1 Tax=Rhipicephalus microplus TaxID=6941 RepID=A0A9J6DS00_RHIMP|nr:hypothetical protein HPB51_002053 [Rhipicephalus microplus]
MESRNEAQIYRLQIRRWGLERKLIEGGRGEKSEVNVSRSFFFFTSAVCLLVNIADVVKGSSGPRWLSEPPARLLFSNWTGATVWCSAEGDPRPNVWWESAVDGLNASALSAATSRPQLLTVHEGTLTFMPFRAHQFREEVHRGFFRCRARNARGTVLSTAVHVNAGKHKLSSRVVCR